MEKDFVLENEFYLDGWEIAVRNAWNTTKPGEFKDIATMLKVRLVNCLLFLNKKVFSCRNMVQMIGQWVEQMQMELI
jgi:hypothetical protein